MKVLFPLLAFVAFAGAENVGAEREKKDRGSATVTIGDTPWEAKRCSARFKGKRLKLSCSRTDSAGGTVRRQSLELVVAEYDGPGTYRADGMGSMFVGVGLDTKKAEAAGDDDAKNAALAMKTIQRAKTIRLAGAEIVITAADDAFIDGTFSSPGVERANKPALDGRFHALVRP